jgi:cytosine/adenosine deaminase-related metal-dependent hydrolase
MPSDFFTQMRSVFTLQRMQAINGPRGGAQPKLLNARGDRVRHDRGAGQSLDRKVGTLTPGKQADIILLRTDTINVMPMNTCGAIVLVDTSNVDTVFIDGKIRKRNGRLVDVDMNRVSRQARESRDFIVSKLGWPKTRLEAVRRTLTAGLHLDLAQVPER